MKLHFIAGKPKDVELDKTRLTIGRGNENDITLEDDDISGFHAEIQKDGDKIYLIDLGSQNGSFHDGKRVQGRVELEAWDRISFASVAAEIVDTDSRRPTRTTAAISDEAVSASASAAEQQRRDDPGATKARPAATGWSLLGVSDDVKQQTFPLAARTTAGRDEACGITLPNEMTSREHARLEIKDDRLVVEDLGSTNGTWVNGKRITGPTTLNAGDEIRFDTTEFRAQGADTGKTAVRKAVADDGADAADASTGGAVLRPDGGKPIRLSGSMSVGRLADNDIVLDDDTVSGHHARIEAKDGTWLLTDLGSSNGTSVSGRSVKKTELKGGEQISFGEVRLVFETARTGSTRHIKAVGGGERTGTRIQKATGDDAASPDARRTATSHRSAARKVSGLPPWIWGLVGFVVVVVVAGGWILWNRIGVPSQQIEAPLQAGQSWRHTLGEQAGARSVISTPVLADINGDNFLDLIVADTDGFVTALDGQEGKRIFETPVPGRVVASLAVADLTGNGISDVVVGTNGGRILALNGDGQLLWSSGEDLALGQITNKPVFADVNGDGVDDVIAPTTSRGLVALDGSRGWEIWSSDEMSSGAVISTPAVGDFNADGAIDFGYVTDAGQAVAISSADSRVWRLWVSDEIGSPDYASPALINVGKQQILVTATNAGITALNAGDGRMVWMNRAGAAYSASPVGVQVTGRNGHDIALVSRDGVVRMLSGDTGDVIWESDLGTTIDASPATLDVTNDGIRDLIILSRDGQLFGIDSDRGQAAMTMNVGEGDSIAASPLLGDLTNDGLVEVTVVDQGGRVSAYTMNRRIRKGTATWPMMLGNQRHAVD